MQASPETGKRRGFRTADVVTWAVLAAVVCGGAGFVYKLVQFIYEAVGESEGSFALVPVSVYVCVAAGFFLLFVWALLRGQFRNVEEPKYRLLEEEEEYERRGI